MVSHHFRPLLGLLLIASNLIGNVGCNSGSNNSMARVGGSKSEVAVAEASNSEAPGPQTEPPLTQSADTPSLAVATSATVPVVDRAGFNEVLAKHKGKVVLVDYWATWCSPCRKKFPHTVALAKQHDADRFAVIGVSLDDDEAHEDVVKFLGEQQATFDNLRSKTGASDESFESFEIANGSLPCLRLFGRDGQVLKTFAIDPDADKQFTDDDVAEAVNTELAKSAN